KDAVKAATSSDLAGQGGINTFMTVAASAIARILCPTGRIGPELGTLPEAIVAAVRLVNPQAADELQQTQLMLLHDIIGNPFRPVRFDPSCLTYNDGTVVKLARSIYDERAFDRLPILADALEEAGCQDGEILGHCRQPGMHVRGCWVVDCLTG